MRAVIKVCVKRAKRSRNLDYTFTPQEMTSILSGQHAQSTSTNYEQVSYAIRILYRDDRIERVSRGTYTYRMRQG